MASSPRDRRISPMPALRRTLDRVTRLGAWLVLPLALLLFVQWPLRDAVGAWSSQANDAAQCLFALYVAIAVRHATVRRRHLAAGPLAARWPPALRARLARYGTTVGVLPWSVYVLVVGAPTAWASVHGLEGFPETFNPGYFVIKAAAWLLALLLAVQSLADAVAPGGRAG
jgi:TRAP-type mannitol/chloroaromatic compound transport system permease small subunit